MKTIFFLIFLIVLPCYAKAETTPSVIVQLKYAPWGLIDADEEDFNYFSAADDGNYDKYEMSFDRSLGARLIATPFYLAINRSTTDINKDTPDAVVETFSAGFAGTVLDINDYNTYLIGAIGIGKGRFTFKDPNMNDWEMLLDGNAEIGFHLEEHLLIGLGVDWQLFGEPGETKANYWNLYLSTGFSF
ncbi:MAG: hypothetical protein IPK77_15330 [Cellvibrio sp.]|nr:hypothetical protein [Cellvibrio sp.]